VRPQREFVSTAPDPGWYVGLVEEERLGAPWHYHEEIELTYTLGGSGQRYVGDDIDGYVAGDLVLIGSNLPHTWQSEGQGPHRQVVAHFQRDFLGAGFLGHPDLAPVAQMLDAASRGLSFDPPGIALDADLRSLPQLASTARLARLLGVLAALSAQPARPLASEAFRVALGVTEQDGRRRVQAVCQYLLDNYAGEVTLAGAAEVAGMTPNSLSRFFQRATGRRFSHYVNEVRIGVARKLLLEREDLTVTEVSAQAGYRNLSNFNRRFRELTGMSPREYRRRFTHL
jgi:AraC-like DNA-binding protein